MKDITTNQQDAKVSIIIPTFKRSDSLERAIVSALGQVHKNIEIIVVDDNAEYPNFRDSNKLLLSKYPNVKLVENTHNLGGGLSRNAGFNASSGDFIAFLDDDDEFMLGKISEQLKLFSKNTKIGIVYSHATVVRVDGSTYSWERNETGVPLEAHIASCVAPSTALLISREAFEATGGFENISSRQDATLIMKIIMSGYSLEVAKKHLYKYFWHDGTNGITKTSPSSLEAELQYRELFLKYASINQLDHKTIKTVLSIFSSRIVPVLIRLGRHKEALVESLTALRRQPFNFTNFSTLQKTLLWPVYIRISMRRERAARLGK